MLATRDKSPAKLDSATDPAQSALARWAEEHAPALKVVAQRRDADGPMVDRALEIVRKFIIDRRLIIFGGLAIDYALRLKGSHIYPDDERPDFDFLSKRSVEDAYELADILVAAGFENVGAVRAIHVQTMRVRTSFISVADVGYAPPAVFDAIPTLEWRGMRIVHPDFQRMDQHLAFCFPFNGPPQEDVFHRWRKDLARFNKFEEHYPVAAAAAAKAGKSVTARLATPIGGKTAQGIVVALHGFAAYAVLRRALDEFATTLRGTVAVSAPVLALSMPDDNSVTISLPVGDCVYLASPQPEAAVAGLEGARWYDPYMDVNPETVRAGNAIVLSTRGRLLAATPATVGDRSVFVVTPQYLLLHFLYESHRAADAAARDIYRGFYAATLEILSAAEKLVANYIVLDPVEQSRVMDLFAHSPFAPTVSTLGDVNHDAAYVIKMASNSEKVRDTPPAALRLAPNIASLLVGLPQNYYPPGKARPAFDYSVSPLFRREGLAR